MGSSHRFAPRQYMFQILNDPNSRVGIFSDLARVGLLFHVHNVVFPTSRAPKITTCLFFPDRTSWQCTLNPGCRALFLDLPHNVFRPP